MKRIILLFLSLFITLAVAAHEGPQVVGDQHPTSASLEVSAEASVTEQATASASSESTVEILIADPSAETEGVDQQTSVLIADSTTKDEVLVNTIDANGDYSLTATDENATTVQSVLMLPEMAEGRMAAEKAEKKPHFLPMKRRINREIDKLKFAYKGELMMGLTASYGTLSSDDTDLMLVFDNINADATIATVKPFIGYFYRDNNCIGIRFGYTHMGGTLDNADFDGGEDNDLSGQLPYVDLSSNEYSFGIFHRSYAGLDPKGRFGLFAEFELALSTGRSNFAYDPDHKDNGASNRTFDNKTQVRLSFNPGAAVYIFPNVCATLSFGLGGIQYTSVTQKDSEGNKVGSRKASNMRFRLNIAAINIGMTFHLWDKKKL